jgi:hypothetical protein
MAAGVFIRHFFNLRHKGRVEWKYPAIGVALLAVAVAIAPEPPERRRAGCRSGAQFTQVKGIIDQRCVSCHAAHPTQPGFATAPAGVMLDDAARHQPERGAHLPAGGAAESHAAGEPHQYDGRRTGPGRAWFEPAPGPTDMTDHNNNCSLDRRPFRRTGRLPAGGDPHPDRHPARQQRAACGGGGAMVAGLRLEAEKHAVPAQRCATTAWRASPT